VGAENIPPEEMLPPLAFQVTAVLLVPLTLAVNCWLVPVASEVEVGEIDTATGTLTLTLADADLLVSATLVAVTV